MKKIIIVAGARPNFMKIAPLLRAFEKYPNLQPVLVHTGQHYDADMSGSFFEDLGIKKPDYNLNVGSGSHAVQTANIMIKFEEVCIKERPDLVIVVGDVNSTIAAGLVTKKLNIHLAHIEAGLRSKDRSMPEEINRIATDAISDLFFTTEPEGNDNLIKEGIPINRIFYVGHVMIDNLIFQIQKLALKEKDLSTYNLKKQIKSKYICVTMHRPSNVDNKDTLSKLLSALKTLSESVPVLFPCHPRTKKQIEGFGYLSMFKKLPKDDEPLDPGFYILNPLGYNDFLYLWKDCAVVVTDSGGLQEETTAVKVPCITMRENTERPITAQIGSNEVVGIDSEKIISLGKSALEGKWKKSEIPEHWDGRASERITDILVNY